MGVCRCGCQRSRPPISPSNVVATLEGPVTSAPLWSDLLIEFDWTHFQVLESPDVVIFEVHLRQGKISADVYNDSTAWGQLEYAPGVSSPPLRISWPDLKIESPIPLGVTVSLTTRSLSDHEGGGKRISLKISPIRSPFDAGGYSRLSATVRSVDEAGNVSNFAMRGIATRVDEILRPFLSHCSLDRN